MCSVILTYNKYIHIHHAHEEPGTAFAQGLQMLQSEVHHFHVKMPIIWLFGQCSGSKMCSLLCSTFQLAWVHIETHRLHLQGGCFWKMQITATSFHGFVSAERPSAAISCGLCRASLPCSFLLNSDIKTRNSCRLLRPMLTFFLSLH